MIGKDLQCYTAVMLLATDLKLSVALCAVKMFRHKPSLES